MAKEIYDVFLSHNGSDKSIVETLAKKLKESGLTPWLDEWDLIPGTPWMPAIEDALQKSHSCAVFVGRKGTGPWQLEEVRAAISKRVASAKGSFRVIPVMLPGAKRPQALPSFLLASTWVKFSRTIQNKRAFGKLVSGILNISPGQNGSLRRRKKACVQATIRVAGTLEQFRKAVAAAEDFLRESAGDSSLTIKYISAGSVVIVIECSNDGFRRLKSSYSDGRLTKISGCAIQTFQRIPRSKMIRSLVHSPVVRDTAANELLANHQTEAPVQNTKPAPDLYSLISTPATGVSKPERLPSGGLTKTQLVRHIAETHGIDNKTASAFLRHLADPAVKETKKSGTFALPGLGRLVKANRKARMGRNPQTGEPIRLPAKTVVQFRVAKSAKNVIAPKK